MGMREKLIELIASKVCDIYSEYSGEWILHDCKTCYTKNCNVAKSADHLIANGVTIPVRCKECDFRVFDDVCKEYYCNCVYGVNGAITDNDFCSYGERKADDST